MTTDELKIEVRKELQRGIDRNKVLPLDWAMDRINPILDKLYQKGRLDVLEEYHTKLCNFKEAEECSYNNSCWVINEIAKIKEVLK